MRNVALTVLLLATAAACATPVVPQPLVTVDHPELIGAAPGEPRVDLGKYEPQTSRPWQTPDLEFAVAISGGGLRAANFGVGVMLALEQFKAGTSGAPVNLLREVDYFSTVSGGGFAAGAYISNLLDHLAAGGKREDFSLDKLYYRATGAPAQTLKRRLQTFGEGLMAQGVLAGITSFVTGYDRGDAFEERIDKLMLGSAERKRNGSTMLRLSEVFAQPGADSAALLPYWVANATVYENGAIFPFTPDAVERYGVVGYKLRGVMRRFGDPGDVPLSVGAKASAAFPVAFPATTLQAKDGGNRVRYLHLLDGGLADNLGVITAVDMLRQIKPAKSADGETAPLRKVLLVIDAFKENDNPYSDGQESPGWNQVVARITDIGLDSWRGRYKELVAAVCAKEGIIPIFLDFDLLASGALDELAKKSLGPAKGPAALKKLHAGARNVATALEISENEQQILIEAGRMLVELFSEDIAKVVRPDLVAPADE